MVKQKRKIRYAVVGLGYIAQVAVLPAFVNAEENSELVALVSGDSKKLKALGEKYNIDKLYLYSEFESLVRSGDIDAVYIATPNDYHRNIMEQAARYGVHVLCEKPLAVTTEDCLSMIQAAKLNHIRLMVAYRLHFEAANLEAIKLAQTRKIGELKIFNSIFTMQANDPHNIRLEDVKKGGGPLYDIGIYCINAARYLFKAAPIEVFAMTVESSDSRFKRSPEMISAVLKFPDQRLATFSISFGAYASADFDLVGTKGRLRLENAYEYSTTMRLKLYQDKKLITKKYSKRDQFAPELIYFSDCILNHKNPEPSGEEGLADIKIIEGLILSMELGTPVKLDEMNKRTRPNEQQKITKSFIPKPKLFHVVTPEGEKH